jgi:hypothetical protein
VGSSVSKGRKPRHRLPGVGREVRAHVGEPHPLTPMGIVGGYEKFFALLEARTRSSATRFA